MPDKKKLALGGFLLLLVVLFFAFNLDQYLRVSVLKELRETFLALYQEHTFPVLGGFFLLYVAVTALSLPGSLVLALATGALFGFWGGLVLTSFASAIGATLACILARYLFRDWARQKLSSWLYKMDSGVRWEGAFYLLTMHLNPAVPFFLINVGMALTSMRIVTFYWVSQVSMLPMAAVVVNAGRQLGEISSTRDIFSADLIISFLILAIFPLAVKKIVTLIRTKLGKGRITPFPESGSGGK
ncbi:MAG: VTT domain-containing protein [Desulfohalobiaceae bacterium]